MSVRSIGLVIAIVLSTSAGVASADEPPAETTPEAPAPAEPAPKTEATAEPEVELHAPRPQSGLMAYISGGAAIAAAAAGAAFGVRALSLSNEYADNPTYHRSNVGETTAFVADVCFGAAFTLAITSVVLFLKKDAPLKKVLLEPAAPPTLARF